MADGAAAAAAPAAESGGEAKTLTFKIKSLNERIYPVSIAENATVLDLKAKLSAEELENVPVERQRLIYSGRVMKNDETLATYKIKHNNIVHMVRSAASNPTQPAPASTPTPAAVPTNMASGTANNPLAGLTGARFAGHQITLPGLDVFGPDGGMGPPMDEERMQSMLSDPNVQQSLNEALSNPDFINMMIDSHPMFRRMPNARELLNSPMMRQMMTNPQLMAQAMRHQRAMQGGGAAFPAPGATDTTPEGAAASSNGASNGDGATGQNPFANPFMNPFMTPGGAGAGANPAQLLQQLAALGVNPFGSAGTDAGTGTTTTTTTQGQTPAAGSGAAQSQQQQQQQGAAAAAAPNAANPFAMLFPPPNAQGGAAEGAQQGNPFGMSGEELQRILQMLGGAGGAAPPPADNRPPEERYAEQLRQLNDMGFYDFDRNVAALRRSGGSVQGAIEHLLSS